MSDVYSILTSIAPQLRDTAKRGGSYWMIQCPFHGGGEEKTPSCSVSTEKPVFHCFSCLESGHLSRLLRQLGMSNTAAKQAISMAGLNSPSQKAADLISQRYSTNPFRGEFVLDEDILDEYRMAPKPLLEKGFLKSTLRHFEVGVDRENLRITFPIRNVYGELVGVSGRALVDWTEPRYKIYKQELIDRGYGVPEDYSMDSVKKGVMWHAHMADPFLNGAVDEAVLVTEGFKACMWSWQAGIKNSVALIGAYLSREHSELIALSTTDVVLFLDNNPAGLRGTFHAAETLLKRGVRVHIARYPDTREQPDDLDEHEVKEAIKEAYSFAEWKQQHRGTVSEAQQKRYLRRARQGR